MLSKILKKSDDAGTERYRKAFLTSAMNIASQFLQLATGLISVPLALDYVGSERFGIWMALSTALTFITFSDFGIGIGVQDRMARLLGAQQQDQARKVFLSSLVFVFGIFVVLMLGNGIVTPGLNISGLLSLKSSEAMNEIIPTTQMVVFVLGLGLLAGLVQRAFNALQEGFWVAMIQMLFRVLSLAMLFMVVELEMGLPALVFVVGGMASTGLLLIGLPLLMYRHKWLIPNSISMPELFDFPSLKNVLRVGSFGLGASIAIYFVNNSPMILMSVKYGAESVAGYAVLLKLVSIPTLLLTYMLLPLWPAITEAKVNNDKIWIKKAYKRCALLAFGLAVVSAAVFIPFGRSIIELWTGNEAVIPSSRLVLASVVFMIIGYWNTLTSVMLNGFSRYKGQSTYGIVLAVFFALMAALVPQSQEKDVIIWVVGAGYLIRCIMMQIEVTRCLNKI